MQYVGLTTQISRNNRNSLLLLIAFPVLLLALFYVVIFAISLKESAGDNYIPPMDPNIVFLRWLPFILGGVAIWFLIAWSSNAAIIRMATGARPLERMENKRVYNLVENLCIQQGMQIKCRFIS